MDKEERSKKLVEIISDGEKLAVLNGAASKEELQESLKQYGVELAEEEVDSFINEMNQLAREGEELDASSLEAVSGGAGITGWTVITTAYSWGKDWIKAGWNVGKWAASKF